MEDVSFDDQRKINTFSRLNLKIKELEAQLASKRRAAEDYEEAENELMLLEEETMPYVVGECLVHLPKESVEERLQKLQEETKAEVSELQEKIRSIGSQMAELKTVLYAKFGNSINLEE